MFVQDPKVTVCLNVFTQPNKHQIPIILEEYHRGRVDIHREIYETIWRIKSQYHWYEMNNDEKGKIVQKT